MNLYRLWNFSFLFMVCLLIGCAGENYPSERANISQLDGKLKLQRVMNFIDAIRADDFSTVKHYIDMGLNLNGNYPKGEYPARYAQTADMVDFLIKNGATVDAGGISSLPPNSFSNKYVLERWLFYGANVNAPQLYDKETPLTNYFKGIRKGVSNAWFEGIKLLINNGAETKGAKKQLAIEKRMAKKLIERYQELSPNKRRDYHIQNYRGAKKFLEKDLARIEKLLT